MWRWANWWENCIDYMQILYHFICDLVTHRFFYPQICSKRNIPWILRNNCKQSQVKIIKMSPNYFSSWPFNWFFRDFGFHSSPSNIFFENINTNQLCFFPMIFKLLFSLAVARYSDDNWGLETLVIGTVN